MLMDDADSVMREVRRVLKPGTLFAGVVGARPPTNPALDLFIALYAGASKRPEVAGMRFGDARRRSEDGVRSLLTPEGLEDLRQRYLFALRPLCGPNGDLLFEDRYQQFSARAAL